MMAISRLDNYVDVGVRFGKVDEVVGGRGGRLLEVGADGGRGAAVFAVPDAQFLQLLNPSGGHFYLMRGLL